MGMKGCLPTRDESIFCNKDKDHTGERIKKKHGKGV